MAGTGGARPGAGRKKGGLNKKTKLLREIAGKALTSGKTPLEVMLENMRFFHDKASELQAKIVAALSEAGPLARGHSAVEGSLLISFCSAELRGRCCSVSACATGGSYGIC